MRIQQSRADGQGIIVEQHSHHQACQQRCQRTFPGFLGADARRHQMTAERTSNEVGKNVSRPHQQQQIEKQERSRPLLAQLHQKSERQSDVDKSKSRNHRSRKRAAQVNSSHGNREKNKGSNRSRESRAVNKDRGREQGLLASRVDGQKQKE